jgi:hypothetical protein
MWAPRRASVTRNGARRPAAPGFAGGGHLLGGTAVDNGLMTIQLPAGL